MCSTAFPACGHRIGGNQRKHRHPAAHLNSWVWWRRFSWCPLRIRITCDDLFNRVWLCSFSNTCAPAPQALPRLTRYETVLLCESSKLQPYLMTVAIFWGLRPPAFRILQYSWLQLWAVFGVGNCKVSCPVCNAGYFLRVL